MTQWPLPKKLRHKNTLALFIYSGCISLIKLVSDATNHFIYRQGGRLVIFALGSVQAGVVYTGVLHCSFLTSSHFVWSLPKLLGMRKECVYYSAACHDLYSSMEKTRWCEKCPQWPLEWTTAPWTFPIERFSTLGDVTVTASLAAFVTIMQYYWFDLVMLK